MKLSSAIKKLEKLGLKIIKNTEKLNVMRYSIEVKANNDIIKMNVTDSEIYLIQSRHENDQSDMCQDYCAYRFFKSLNAALRYSGIKI